MGEKDRAEEQTPRHPEPATGAGGRDDEERAGLRATGGLRGPGDPSGDG